MHYLEKLENFGTASHLIGLKAIFGLFITADVKFNYKYTSTG
jgi:hypothetical protein